MLPSAEYVKEAVAEDNAGNYQRAFELYKIALEYFGTHLKYEKNARARETITAKAGVPLTFHTPPASQIIALTSSHQGQYARSGRCALMPGQASSMLMSVPSCSSRNILSGQSTSNRCWMGSSQQSLLQMEPPGRR